MPFRLLPEDRFAKLAYVWLIYLASPIWVLWTHHGSDRILILKTIGAIAVFLPLYFWSYWLRGPRVLLPLIGITEIGLLLAPHNAGGCVFFVYAGGLAHRTGWPRVSIPVLLSIVATVLLQGALGRLDQPSVLWAAAFTSLIGGIVIYQADAADKLQAVQDHARYLAVLAERERIGRDLHDLLGHTLSVITLKAELASKVASRDPERSIAEMRDVERISRDGLAEVRRAIQASHPAAIADELRNARAALNTASIALTSEVPAISIEPLRERVLALAIREAVTNVIRHSSAKNCVIQLQQAVDSVRLRISDDGVGGAVHHGSGLSGMRARIAELGGHLEIEGGHGVHLTITLPMLSSPTAVAARAETVA